VKGYLYPRPRQRSQDGWVIVLTGVPKPGGGVRQRQLVVHGSREEAEAKLRGLLTDADRNEFVDPSRLTVGQWLDQWLEQRVRPKKAFNTAAAYGVAIRRMKSSALGSIRLQALRVIDVETYLTSLTNDGFAAATVDVHRTVLSAAVRRAMHDDLVRKNVVSLAERSDTPAAPCARESWSLDEMERVVTAAAAMSAQNNALINFALDTGARRGEVLGARWSDVDLGRRTVRIARQFLRLEDGLPVFGPTKTRNVRTITISAETVQRLVVHKRTQAEERMQNRLRYSDFNLVFARSHDEGGTQLGFPLGGAALRRILDAVIAAADVKRIPVHGLRHTSASLLLAAGVQPYVVQRRLGHSAIATTLDVYAHVLPTQQDAAAELLADMMHAKRKS
jgi:integrase